MIRTHTLKTVPFAIMRPTLKTFMASTLLVFGQATDIDEKLSTKIFLLRDKTNALQNPTRHHMQTHLAAWYGVALEVADAADAGKPELAGLLRNVLKEAEWIAPAWEYMQGKLQEWATENKTQ